LFAPSVLIDGRVVDVETGTATAYVPRNARFPGIVLALDSSDLRELACGELTWR
jgi:hypothetical protein